MKSIIQILFLLITICDDSMAQDVINGYNRLEVGCMTLLSERSNVVFINDTNFVDYHYNGYRREQLIMKGDSSVQVINRNRGLPIIIPTKDTFELSIYNKTKDSLLFTEKFIAIDRDSLKVTHNTLNRDTQFCDYIFSTKTESILYRSMPNQLILRTNNYDRSLITFEIDNGVIISGLVDNLVVQPGKGKISEIRVYCDGKISLSKQFIVGK
jgi:hypothetical protein